MSPFSVVIATYDRGSLIEATLESVARQTLQDIEVLVVSDGPMAAANAARNATNSATVGHSMLLTSILPG